MPPTGLAFLTTTTLASCGAAPPVPLLVVLVLEESLLSLPPDRAMTKATAMTTTASPSRVNRWFRDTVFSLLGCSVEGSAERRRSAAREVAGQHAAPGGDWRRRDREAGSERGRQRPGQRGERRRGGRLEQLVGPAHGGGDDRAGGQAERHRQQGAAVERAAARDDAFGALLQHVQDEQRAARRQPARG